jgi:FkbM family methyltransferase
MYYNPNNSCQVENLAYIYEKVFGFIDNGIFVEVGAFDGETFSNTNFLADLGWKGLYIEPSYDAFKECYNRHYYNNNTNVINCSVGCEEGEVSLYKSFSNSYSESTPAEFGYLTTTNLQQTSVVPQFDWSSHFGFSEIKCSQHTLHNVLVDNKIPKNFDILVVDVEGNEEDVINSFSIEEWKPKMMIIELVDENLYYQQFSDIIEKNKNLRKKITENGYREIYKDGTNTIFVDTGLDIPL